MMEGPDFAARDREYAHRFAAAARRARVVRAIYLGGLYPRGAAPLSPHLQSRREVGEILIAECGAIAVRAGIVVGRGSAAFEIMRSLVSHLPVMITPKWVSSRCQPIDVGDAIEALARAPKLPAAREVDLAGPDILSYRAMMAATAEELHLQALDNTGARVQRLPILALAALYHRRARCRWRAPWLKAYIRTRLPTGPDLCAELGITPIGFRPALRRALADRGAGWR